MKIDSIKKFIKRLIWRHQADSQVYVKWLKKQGCEVGGGVHFIDPRNSWVDISRPWMVKIGNNVTITSGVTILTHDYGWSVMKAVYGDVIGNAKPAIIGNNVFIGMGTFILGGAKIGNNVIIGANSTVSGVIPDNCVVAGNPAKVICTLDEYKEKRESLICDETKIMLEMYYEKYNKIPSEDILYEHFWICENDIKNLSPILKDTLGWVKGSKEKTVNKFITHKPYYDSYNELLLDCDFRNKDQIK